MKTYLTHLTHLLSYYGIACYNSKCTLRHLTHISPTSHPPQHAYDRMLMLQAMSKILYINAIGYTVGCTLTCPSSTIIYYRAQPLAVVRFNLSVTIFPQRPHSACKGCAWDAQ